MKFYYDKQSFLFGNSRGKNWAEDQCRWYLITNQTQLIFNEKFN